MHVGAATLRMLRALLGQARAGSSRAPSTARSRSMGSVAHGGGEAAAMNDSVFRVLFCGEEFRWGYQFSKEALADDPGFEVGLRCCAMPLQYPAHTALRSDLGTALPPLCTSPYVHACCKRHAACRLLKDAVPGHPQVVQCRQ